MRGKLDFSGIRHVKVHKSQFDVIEEKATAVIIECKEDGRCISFDRSDRVIDELTSRVINLMPGHKDDILLIAKNLREEVL